MKEMLEKISSYNIFNYLLPGSLFVVFVEKITTYKIYHQDVITLLFVYYFTGMIISRIGSIMFEPIAKKVKFVKFSNYTDFIAASEKDVKIELLSETNNVYRTFCALFIVLGFVKLYEYLSTRLEVQRTTTFFVLLLCLFLLFAFSYKKQTNYIFKRVEAKK